MDLQCSITEMQILFTNIKHNFFQKVAFYICEENTRLSYGVLEVHKQKAHARFDFNPLGSSENYQITLDKSSILMLSLIPLISSL